MPLRLIRDSLRSFLGRGDSTTEGTGSPQIPVRDPALDVGDCVGERGRLETREMAVVPSMVPHDVFCASDQPVKVVGWFASATVVSVFDEPFAPIGKRVLGTPLPEEAAAASA